ncbi:hypothetical protein ACSZN3_21550 [Aeromonas hydrophila]|uniref:hypothetical protein n=1 Tax=Aeromonas hydrophila TaxID=644 RepID=UPI003EC6827D
MLSILHGFNFVLDYITVKIQTEHCFTLKIKMLKTFKIIKEWFIKGVATLWVATPFQ